MKRLLLVGAGHAHAQVLKNWIAQPLPATELVLVSPQALAPYSGMVPGWLAGTYRYADICIDFAALAALAGARWVIGELATLDAQRGQVQLTNGQVLAYDLLSLNVGSTLHPPPSQRSARVLALRPLGALRCAWEQVLADPELLSRSQALLPGLAPGAQRAARAAPAAAGVRVTLGSSDGDVPAEGLLLVGHRRRRPRLAGRQRTGGGRARLIRVDACLRSVSHPQVQAVGDCAAWSTLLPKAGVHEVRTEPVLSHNLPAALGHGRALPHQPQLALLALLATADGRAIASWRGLSAQGRWVWRWKNRIDRGFVRRFATTAHPQIPMPSSPSTGDPA